MKKFPRVGLRLHSPPHPATGNQIFEIQSRARALDNNMYLVAPNMGTY